MLKLFASVLAERNALDRSEKSGVIVLTSDQKSNYKKLVREALKIFNPTSPGGSGLPPLERH